MVHRQPGGGQSQPHRFPTGGDQAVAPRVQGVLQQGEGHWWQEVAHVLEDCTGAPCWSLDLGGVLAGQEAEVVQAVRQARSEAGTGPGPSLVVVRAATGLRDLHDGDVHLLALGEQVDAETLVAAAIALEHPRRAQVVSLTGSSGGLGVSTLLVLVAAELARLGRAVAVADLDPGGGLGLLLGDHPLTGLRWADLDPQETVFLPQRLVQALPSWRGVTVLTGDARGGARGTVVQTVLEALAAVHDVVLLDLPRGQIPWPGGLPLLVTSLDLRNATAAEALARHLPAAEARRLRLVVRQGGLDLDVAELESMTGGALLGVLGHDRRAASRQQRGEDPSRCRGAAARDAALLARSLLTLLEREP